MSQESDPEGVVPRDVESDAVPDLRTLAEIGDLERREYSLRLVRTGSRWVVLPGLALLFARMAWRAAELGLLTTAGGIGQLLGLAIGSLSILFAVRRLDDDIADLELEREQLAETCAPERLAPPEDA